MLDPTNTAASKPSPSKPGEPILSGWQLTRRRIKAFLSYDRSDSAIAVALQRGLQQFAKPFYRFRTFPVFRDETDLLVGQELLLSIKRALADSEFFILLASPESADSAWVAREVETWLNGSSEEARRAAAGKILLVLTAGEIVWDWDDNDFDWRSTNALPRLFSRMYRQEPNFLDLRWARNEKSENLNISNNQFKSAIATLAAPLHAKLVGEILGEEVRQHRITKWVIRLVLAVLTTLTVIAGWQWRQAVAGRIEAELQRDLADTQTKNAVHLLKTTRQNLDLAQRNLYAANIARAREAWERGNCSRSLDILDLEIPKSGGIDRRGFEWFHLQRRCRGEVAQLLPIAVGNRLALSSDGRRLLVGQVLYEGEPWVEAGTLEDVGTPGGGSFSKDGSVLAYGGYSGRVKLRDLSTGREQVALEALPGGGFALPVVLSENARWLAAGSQRASQEDGDAIRLLDRQTNALKTLEYGKLRLYSVAISPDGRWIAAGWGKGNFRDHLTGRVTMWDLSAGRATLHSISPDQKSWVTAIAFSPDGKTLASSDAHGSVKLWSAGTGREIARLGQHEGDASAVAFRDSRTLVSSGWDGTIRVWDIKKRTQSDLIRNPELIIHALAVGSSGKLMATADLKAVRVWNLSSEVPGRTILRNPHGGEVNSLAFSPDGRELVSASTENLGVWLWDIAAKRGRETRAPRAWSPSAAGFLANPRFLAAALQGVRFTWRLSLWDLERPREEPKSFWDGPELISAMAVSPRRNQIAACRTNGEILIQDLSGKARIFTTGVVPRLLCTLAFSKDGQFLAWGETGGTVQIWNVMEPAKQPLYQRNYDFRVSSLAFSPNESRLAVGLGTRLDDTQTGSLSVWSFTTGEEVSTSGQHEASVTSVTFSPDGRSLATGSWDATIRLWDPVTLQEILRLREHASPIFSVEFAPVGHTLAAGHKDGTVVLWQGTNESQPRSKVE